MFRQLLNRMSLPVFATGGYVIYTETSRYPKMEKRFARGALLGPVSDNDFEIAYLHRPTIEGSLHRILKPTFTNQYYLIRGDIGTGKSRLVVEAVRSLINDSGKKGEGAPIYVLASQGKSFADTLSKAVNFNYDEHISFTFALNIILKVDNVPSKKEHEKLKRVLEAIEMAAYKYTKKNGRPVVIIIDDIGWVARRMKGALQLLQRKAKFWADANIAKVVFVTNDELVEALFQKQQSYWSRCDVPLEIGDLSDEEALSYLVRNEFYESGTGHLPAAMDPTYAKTIVSFVGGRIHHLNQCRRYWEEHLTTDESFEKFQLQALEKMLDIWRSKKLQSALALFDEKNNYCIPLQHFIEYAGSEALITLLESGILSVVRNTTDIRVKVESRTMETVIRQMLSDVNKS